MRTYRLLNADKGFFELFSQTNNHWFSLTSTLKRQYLIDPCEDAYAEHGLRVINNTNPELLHIMEPGKIVTITHNGYPVYLTTSDINKYHIVHNNQNTVTISFPPI